jgi:AcrR family transcriptional regulator
MSDSAAGRRRKLDPDPKVRVAILAVSSKIVREEGVRALGVAEVLARTELSTRAFYRHFGSKDELVSAVFLEMARVETRRLRRAMAVEADSIRSVMAWIDGRLDLVFDSGVGSDLRHVSLEAQSQTFAAPDLVNAAYGEILRPLVEELERGRELGMFPEVDPASDALSIHGAVWASIERHWASEGSDPLSLRDRTQRFCLGGIGVAPDRIAEVLADTRRGRWKSVSRTSR